jgi:hypothetical protein
MQRIVFDGDIAILRMEGDVGAADGTLIPAELESAPSAALRLINGVVTDIRGTTTFFVDDQSHKHVIADTKWQPITCKWDDKLTKDPQTNYWRVYTDADQLLQIAGKMRYDKENFSTVKFGEMIIRTDFSTRTRLLYACLAGGPMRWKAENGWFNLNATQVTELAKTISAHVEKCFQTEETVNTSIRAGQITTTEQVSTAFAGI